jgi:hypothetical protein
LPSFRRFPPRSSGGDTDGATLEAMFPPRETPLPTVFRLQAVLWPGKAVSARGSSDCHCSFLRCPGVPYAPALSRMDPVPPLASLRRGSRQLDDDELQHDSSAGDPATGHGQESDTISLAPSALSQLLRSTEDADGYDSICIEPGKPPSGAARGRDPSNSDQRSDYCPDRSIWPLLRFDVVA